MNTSFSDVLRVPDTDPIFDGAPAGYAASVDGVMYVRESEWAQFLVECSKAALGKDFAAEIAAKIGH